MKLTRRFWPCLPPSGALRSSHRLHSNMVGRRSRSPTNRQQTRQVPDSSSADTAKFPQTFRFSNRKAFSGESSPSSTESSTAGMSVPITAGMGAALALLSVHCTRCPSTQRLRWLLMLPKPTAPNPGSQNGLRECPTPQTAPGGLIPFPVVGIGADVPLGRVPGAGWLRRSDHKFRAEPSGASGRSAGAAGSHAGRARTVTTGAQENPPVAARPRRQQQQLGTCPGVPTRLLPLPPPPPDTDTCGAQPPSPLPAPRPTRSARRGAALLSSAPRAPAAPGPRRRTPQPAAPRCAPAQHRPQRPGRLPSARSVCFSVPHRPGRAAPSSRPARRGRGPGRGWGQHRAASCQSRPLYGVGRGRPLGGAAVGRSGRWEGRARGTR